MRRILKIKKSEKKEERTNSLKRNITVIYNIGSKSHKAEFKYYSMFGLWIVNHWRGIKIIDISVE